LSLNEKKQVILDKRDYDAMEDELTDLRTIVNSRTMLTIVEESLHWYRMYNTANGTRIKYVLGTESDEDKIKVFTEQVEFLNDKLKKMEKDLNESYEEQGRRQDEINRLKKLKWYDKITIWKKIKNI
jgi:hypothetical protein